MVGDAAQEHLLRRLAVAAALLLAVAAAVVLLFEGPGARAAQPARVQVAGHAVNLPRPPEDAVSNLIRAYLSTEISLVLDGERVSASRAAAGLAVNVDHLRALLRDAADPTSAMRRLHQEARGDAPLRLPMPVVLNDEQAVGIIHGLKDRTDRPPRSARIDPRTLTVVPGEPGRELHVVRTLVRLEQAARDGLTEIQAVAVHPTPDARPSPPVPNLSETLSRFATRYDGPRPDPERARDLQRVARRLDGWMILPGEVLDFNRAAAGWAHDRGHRRAAAIAEGQLTRDPDHAAGQVASTLYAAVVFAGLPILTRTPQPRPTAYIKLGLDAAVRPGALNLRFRNDREFPIVVGAVAEHGELSVALHGARQDRDVTFSRRIAQALPFPERIERDPSLPRGLRVLAQRGIPGFEVTRTRRVRDRKTGHIDETTDRDAYPPTAQVWRVGTGPERGPEFVPPDNDPRPEYVADEVLEIARAGNSPDLTVTTVRGPYGQYGWTIREGMLRSTGDSPRAPHRHP